MQGLGRLKNAYPDILRSYNSEGYRIIIEFLTDEDGRGIAEPIRRELIGHHAVRAPISESDDKALYVYPDTANEESDIERFLSGLEKAMLIIAG